MCYSTILQYKCGYATAAVVTRANNAKEKTTTMKAYMAAYERVINYNTHSG